MENIWNDAIEEYRDMMPKLCRLLGCNDNYYHNKWYQDGHIDFLSILACIRSRLWDNWKDNWKVLSDEDKAVLQWGINQAKLQIGTSTWEFKNIEQAYLELTTGMNEQEIKEQQRNAIQLDAVDTLITNITQKCADFDRLTCYGEDDPEYKQRVEWHKMLMNLKKIRKIYVK